MMNQAMTSEAQCIYEYQLEKVLSTCKDEFVRDFDVIDIRHGLITNDIFTNDEIKEITSEQTNSMRIEKMFFLLVYKNKDLRTFMSVLSVNYDWLSRRIEETQRIVFEVGVDHEEYYNSIRRLRKEIPRHIDYNVHRHDYVSTISMFSGLQEHAIILTFVYQPLLSLHKKILK